MANDIKVYYLSSVIPSIQNSIDGKIDMYINGREHSQINSHKYAQQFLTKLQEQLIQWRKKGLFNNNSGELDIHSHKNEPQLKPLVLYKKQFK